MDIKRIKDTLPPEGVPVLLYVKHSQVWMNNKEFRWRIGYLVSGISQEERTRLSKGNAKEVLRSRTQCSGDEVGNNKTPYIFEEIGPGRIFGQNVILWCRLP